MRVCSVHGCPTIFPASEGSRCLEHRRAASRGRDATRDRYTNTRGHKTFRAAVLAHHPICVICHRAPSVIADHYPLGRDELVARGLDPNDPSAGRGLCKPCDSTQTAGRQPGGWNQR
jgi:5-methylcytosine-specific restriction protein A